ncbi:hypothetical protein [Leptospira jelokensis]|uniref:hypothetical protein n=1 Tax=Leptospira jelokensis TaxID=2484931 RepID=UPI0010913B91|nr:hypothetical protein [Leptospira jelokensis]TGM06454.1 hypothetical protein EHQ79_00405 [Leptospira jelokensis]
MLNKLKNFIISIPIADLVAIITSILAIFISSVAYIEQRETFNTLYKENLSIIVKKKEINHTTEFIKGFGEVYPSFFTIENEIMISNKSTLPITIVDYNIKYKDVKNNPVYYSSRIKDTILDNQIPLTIEGRNSKVIIVKLYFPLSPKIHDILKKEFSINSRPLYSEFNKVVFSEGMDLFENSIDFFETENDEFIINYKNKINYPIKLINFVTSLGNEYSSEIN